jgi:hypothetical protein
MRLRDPAITVCHLKTDLLGGISSESVVDYRKNEVQSPSLDRMLQFDPARRGSSADGGDIAVGVAGHDLVAFARGERLAPTNLISGGSHFRIVANSRVNGSSEHGA